MYFLAILAAATAKFLLGWLWYSPVMFLKPYLAGIGIGQEEMRRTMGKALAGDFLFNLIMAGALQWLLDRAVPQSPAEALTVALVAWLGFTLTANAASVGYERRPARVVAISTSFHLVGAVVMAGVLWFMLMR